MPSSAPQETAYYLSWHASSLPQDLCITTLQRASQLILCSTFLPFVPGAVVQVNVLESAVIGSSLLVSARPIKTEGTQGASYSSAAQSFKMPNILCKKMGATKLRQAHRLRTLGPVNTVVSHSLPHYMGTIQHIPDCRTERKRGISSCGHVRKHRAPGCFTSAMVSGPQDNIPGGNTLPIDPHSVQDESDCLIEYWFNPENAPQLAFAWLTLVDKYSQ
ncbi:hypothetical protein DFH08DRAFT_802177 [Mycena albidolilacea]|uniref:Uncharacterized protein n=1 Tax=Mycena albidolilacea TaxID=1033008 RepID=A0AAD7EY04_9AGAR|nr:hypothetical protein DFH08DRAFT_802177 [Mycena albidolilacea]